MIIFPCRNHQRFRTTLQAPCNLMSLAEPGAISREVLVPAYFIYIYYYYYYYYLADCMTFLHLPAPIWQLYYILPPVVSVIPVFYIYYIILYYIILYYIILYYIIYYSPLGTKYVTFLLYMHDVNVNKFQTRQLNIMIQCRSLIRHVFHLHLFLYDFVCGLLCAA